MLSEERSE